jgi:hypothetical protein
MRIKRQLNGTTAQKPVSPNSGRYGATIPDEEEKLRGTAKRKCRKKKSSGFAYRAAGTRQLCI